MNEHAQPFGRARMLESGRYAHAIVQHILLPAHTTRVVEGTACLARCERRVY